MKPSSSSSESLAELAERYNKTLPKRIDDATTLNSFYLENNEARYSVTLTQVAASQVPPSALDAARTQLITNLCKDKDFKHLIDKGIAINYVVWGNDGGYIKEIKIKPSDCSA